MWNSMRVTNTSGNGLTSMYNPPLLTVYLHDHASVLRKCLSDFFLFLLLFLYQALLCTIQFSLYILNCLHAGRCTYIISFSSNNSLTGFCNYCFFIIITWIRTFTSKIIGYITPDMNLYDHNYARASDASAKTFMHYIVYAILSNTDLISHGKFPNSVNMGMMIEK